jgi:hypothetical protein
MKLIELHQNVYLVQHLRDGRQRSRLPECSGRLLSNKQVSTTLLLILRVTSSHITALSANSKWTTSGLIASSISKPAGEKRARRALSPSFLAEFGEFVFIPIFFPKKEYEFLLFLF